MEDGGHDRLSDLNMGMLPLAKLIGITFTAAEPDRILAEMLVRDDLSGANQGAGRGRPCT